MQCFAFGDVLLDALVGSFEHVLVERVTEALAGFLYLFGNLVVVLGNLVLDEDIRAVAFLGIAVVNQRIVEGVHVSRSLPSGRVHKDSGIDADDVLMQQRHGIPPVTLDVILQLHAVLTVVIDRAESVVNLAGREYKAVFLAMGDDFLECFFLCLCHNIFMIWSFTI